MRNAKLAAHAETTAFPSLDAFAQKIGKGQVHLKSWQRTAMHFFAKYGEDGENEIQDPSRSSGAGFVRKSENFLTNWSRHESSPLSRWSAQRRIYSDFPRQAREMGDQPPSFCRLRDLSHTGFACRPESYLCIANKRMVRADHLSLR